MGERMNAETARIEFEHRPTTFWTSPDDSYHTQTTLAKALDLSESCLQNWRCQGGGPSFVKRGKLVYYRKIDVLNWLRSFEGPAETISSLSANDSLLPKSNPQAA